MSISGRAQQVHDELFPGHVSTLSATDPKLIEYFDNFAFDECFATGTCTEPGSWCSLHR
jgi:4-carboxymuconolactone decarboxylase